MKYERDIPSKGSVRIFVSLENEEPTVDLISKTVRELEGKIPYGFGRVGPQLILVVKGRISIETRLKYTQWSDDLAAEILNVAGFEF